jgi:hypothetical protein
MYIKFALNTLFYENIIFLLIKNLYFKFLNKLNQHLIKL